MPKVAGKRSKSPDRRPARVKYWAGNHLEKNKVKNLIRWGMRKVVDGQRIGDWMTKTEIALFWRQQRKTRIRTSIRAF